MKSCKYPIYLTLFFAVTAFNINTAYATATAVPQAQTKPHLIHQVLTSTGTDAEKEKILKKCRAMAGLKKLGDLSSEFEAAISVRETFGGWETPEMCRNVLQLAIEQKLSSRDAYTKLKIAKDYPNLVLAEQDRAIVNELIRSKNPDLRRALQTILARISVLAPSKDYILEAVLGARKLTIEDAFSEVLQRKYKVPSEVITKTEGIDATETNVGMIGELINAGARSETDALQRVLARLYSNVSDLRSLNGVNIHGEMAKRINSSVGLVDALAGILTTHGVYRTELRQSIARIALNANVSLPDALQIVNNVYDGVKREFPHLAEEDCDKVAADFFKHDHKDISATIKRIYGNSFNTQQLQAFIEDVTRGGKNFEEARSRWDLSSHHGLMATYPERFTVEQAQHIANIIKTNRIDERAAIESYISTTHGQLADIIRYNFFEYGDSLYTAEAKATEIHQFADQLCALKLFNYPQGIKDAFAVADFAYKNRQNKRSVDLTPEDKVMEVARWLESKNAARVSAWLEKNNLQGYFYQYMAKQILKDNLTIEAFHRKNGEDATAFRLQLEANLAVLMKPILKRLDPRGPTLEGQNVWSKLFDRNQAQNSDVFIEILRYVVGQKIEGLSDPADVTKQFRKNLLRAAVVYVQLVQPLPTSNQQFIPSNNKCDDILQNKGENPEITRLVTLGISGLAQEVINSQMRVRQHIVEDVRARRYIAAWNVLASGAIDRGSEVIYPILAKLWTNRETQGKMQELVRVWHRDSDEDRESYLRALANHLSPIAEKDLWRSVREFNDRITTASRELQRKIPGLSDKAYQAFAWRKYILKEEDEDLGHVNTEAVESALKIDIDQISIPKILLAPPFLGQQTLARFDLRIRTNPALNKERLCKEQVFAGIAMTLAESHLLNNTREAITIAQAVSQYGKERLKDYFKPRLKLPEYIIYLLATEVEKKLNSIDSNNLLAESIDPLQKILSGYQDQLGTRHIDPRHFQGIAQKMLNEGASLLEAEIATVVEFDTPHLSPARDPGLTSDSRSFFLQHKDAYLYLNLLRAYKERKILYKSIAIPDVIKGYQHWSKIPKRAATNLEQLFTSYNGQDGKNFAQTHLLRHYLHLNLATLEWGEVEKTFDLGPLAQEKLIKDIANVLYYEGKNIFSTTLKDLAKSYRASSRQQPRTVGEKQRKKIDEMQSMYLAKSLYWDSFRSADNPEYRKWNTIARNGYMDPRHSGVQDTMMRVLKDFVDQQEGPCQLNIDNLRFDPWLPMPDEEEPAFIDDTEYHAIRDSIARKIRDATLQGRWKSLCDNDIHPVVITDGLQQSWRVRVKKYYNKVIGGELATQDHVETCLFPLHGMARDYTCQNGWNEALQKLEEALQKKPETLYEMIAYIAAKEKRDILERMGREVAQSARNEAYLPEYQQWLKIALNRPASVDVLEFLSTDGPLFTLQERQFNSVSNLTRRFIEQFREALVPCIMKSIKFVGNSNPYTIPIEKIREWAESHPVYCNHTEKKLDHALIDDETKQVKVTIVNKILEDAGYIRSA